MAGLDPAIHVFEPRTNRDVDARDSPRMTEYLEVLRNPSNTRSSDAREL